jgi:hypothetical protein
MSKFEKVLLYALLAFVSGENLGELFEIHALKDRLDRIIEIVEKK